MKSTVLARLLDTIINKQKVLVDKLMGTKDVVYFSANPGKNLSRFQMRVLRNESGRHKKPSVKSVFCAVIWPKL
jgi:hypothetical protein